MTTFLFHWSVSEVYEDLSFLWVPGKGEIAFPLSLTCMEKRSTISGKYQEFAVLNFRLDCYNLRETVTRGMPVWKLFVCLQKGSKKRGQDSLLWKKVQESGYSDIVVAPLMIDVLTQNGKCMVRFNLHCSSPLTMVVKLMWPPAQQCLKRNRLVTPK